MVDKRPKCEMRCEGKPGGPSFSDGPKRETSICNGEVPAYGLHSVTTVPLMQWRRIEAQCISRAIDQPVTAITRRNSLGIRAGMEALGLLWLITFCDRTILWLDLLLIRRTKLENLPRYPCSGDMSRNYLEITRCCPWFLQLAGENTAIEIRKELLSRSRKPKNKNPAIRYPHSTSTVQCAACPYIWLSCHISQHRELA